MEFSKFAAIHLYVYFHIYDTENVQSLINWTKIKQSKPIEETVLKSGSLGIQKQVQISSDHTPRGLHLQYFHTPPLLVLYCNTATTFTAPEPATLSSENTECTRECK